MRMTMHTADSADYDHDQCTATIALCDRAGACLRTGEVQRREPRHRREPERCHPRRAEHGICNATFVRSAYYRCGWCDHALHDSDSCDERVHASTHCSGSTTPRSAARACRAAARTTRPPPLRGGSLHARPHAHLHRLSSERLERALHGCEVSLYRPLRASLRAPQLVGSPPANSPAQSTIARPLDCSALAALQALSA